MANSVTIVEANPLYLNGVGQTYEYDLNLDQINTDFQVRAAVTNKINVVTGLLLQGATSAVITLKSGTGKARKFTLSQNQYLPIFYQARLSEALIIQTDTATTSVIVQVMHISKVLLNAFMPLLAGGGSGGGSGGSSFNGVLAASEAHIGLVTGSTAIVSANFTRPADTSVYAIGDLIANSTTAGSVVPMSFDIARINDGPLSIRAARIEKTGTSITNAAARVHLYRTSPTVTNGDNGVWLSTKSGYLGALDVVIDKAFSDGAKGRGVPTTGAEIIALPTSGAKTIFGLLEARNTYTPGNAEVWTVELEAFRD